LSVGVFLAVLFAAALHAAWNAIIRFGRDKVLGMFMMSSSQGLMGLAMVLVLPFPHANVWKWLALSTLLHSAYKAFLTLAYARGDLSRVYPIARGTAPMLVALVGVFVLADRMSVPEYLGIFALGGGILLMAHGVFSQGESRRLLPFALASAVMTAGYSLTDGSGARIAGDASVFVAWAFMLDGILFGTWAIAHRGPALLVQPLKSWALGALAGGASFAAYWIVVFAMTRAPIALVTALRETSVLFAVLIGVVFFGESAERGKYLAAILILCGVALTRI